MEFEEFLKNNKKEHLIFDFDGTLCLLLMPWELFELRTILKKIDSSLDDETSTIYGVINNHIRKYGNEARALVLDYIINFEKEHFKDFEINKELIPFFNKNVSIKKHIWSSNTKSTIYEILDELNLRENFETIITCEDVKLFKPDKNGFTLINKKGEDKHKYLMIGDSINDEKAAKNAGIDFFKVDYFKLGL
ncbi:MAG TPA: HAD-IA family hydrolase [Candidatus Nitrosocosmicus sp.]|nr:HAD-IA family hydrolase [Candidatus Nitrosocosmicus sp.]